MQGADGDAAAATAAPLPSSPSPEPDHHEHDEFAVNLEDLSDADTDMLLMEAEEADAAAAAAAAAAAPLPSLPLTALPPAVARPNTAPSPARPLPPTATTTTKRSTAPRYRPGTTTTTTANNSNGYTGRAAGPHEDAIARARLEAAAVARSRRRPPRAAVSPPAPPLAGPWRPTGRGTRASDPFPERLIPGAAGDAEAELTFQPCLFRVGGGSGSAGGGFGGSGLLENISFDAFLARLGQSGRQREAKAAALRRRVAAERAGGGGRGAAAAAGADEADMRVRQQLVRDRRCVADFAASHGWGVAAAELFDAATGDRVLNRAVLDHREQLGLGKDGDGDSGGEGSEQGEEVAAGADDALPGHAAPPPPPPPPLTPLLAVLRRKRGAAKVAAVAAAARAALFLERYREDLASRGARLAALRRDTEQRAAAEHAEALRKARGGGSAGGIGVSTTAVPAAGASSPEGRDWLLAAAYFEQRLGWRGVDGEEEEEEDEQEEGGDGGAEREEEEDEDGGRSSRSRHQRSRGKAARRRPPPIPTMTPERAEIVLADERVQALLRRAAALARSEKGKAGDGARQGVDWSAAPWASDGLAALQDAARRREERRRQREEAQRGQGNGKDATVLLPVAAAGTETAEDGDDKGPPPPLPPPPPPPPPPPACGETPLDRAVRLLAASAGRPGSLGPAQILAMGGGKDKTAAGSDESATQRRLRRRAVASFRALRTQEFVEHAEADLAARAARQAAEEAALAERLRGRVVDAGQLEAFFSRLSSDAAKRSAQLDARRAEHAEREIQAVRASGAAARHGGGGGMRPGTAPAAGRHW